MKWLEARIVFEHVDHHLISDLISDVFYEFGLQGVVVEDPGIEPEEDWAEDAIGRPDQHAVTGYLQKDSQADQRCKVLEEKLRHLKQEQGLVYRISYKELDEQDWAQAWKAYFGPQKISPRLVVKPTWREYQPDGDELVIELDPGMAFGTGTHPTTALCLTLIERYLRRGDSFLDVGTGSGILMIAAAKLGAGKLCGIDKDEVALEVAARNLQLNRIDPRMFRLTTGDLFQEINDSYGFIVANIFSHVILELLKDICRVLALGGIFVCSGIIEDNKDLILSAMTELGFEIVEIAVKEEWVAIAGRLQANYERLKAEGAR